MRIRTFYSNSECQQEEILQKICGFTEEKIILQRVNNKINENAFFFRENYKRVLSSKISRGLQLVHKAKGNKSPYKRSNFSWLKMQFAFISSSLLIEIL